MYDASLDGQTFLIFTGTSLLTIFISAAFPILQVICLNPKKILLWRSWHRSQNSTKKTWPAVHWSGFFNQLIRSIRCRW